MSAFSATLFSFAEIKATITITDESNVIGRIEAIGFDNGGEYAFGNIIKYFADFDNPIERDECISECLAFCSREMAKRAKWQAE